MRFSLLILALAAASAASAWAEPDAAALAAKEAEQMQQALRLPPPTKKVEILREHLKESVRKDAAFAASILRGWLEEDAR